MEIKIDGKHLPLVRQAYTTCRDAFASAAQQMDDPALKEQFTRFGTGYGEFLATLPTDEAAPVDGNALIQSLLAQVSNSSALCTAAAVRIAALKTEHASALAAAVTTEITRRITAGELFDKTGLEAKVTEAKAAATAGLTPKDEVQSLCAAAKTAGLTEGKTQAKAEYDALIAGKTLIDQRKSALASANLALPSLADLDRILGLKTEEYTPLETKAKARVTELEGMGVQLASLGAPLQAKIWADDTAWTEFKELAATFASGGESNVFAVPGMPSGKPKAMIA